MYNLDTVNDEEEIKLPSDSLPSIMSSAINNVKEGRMSKLNDKIQDIAHER
jgi:hypothetical protein